MQHLVESIQILSRFATEIGNRTSLILDFGFAKTGFNPSNKKNLTLLNSLFYMTIIDSVSYLDEYDNIFGITTENEFKERVIIVKRINKPLISKIKEWKHLRALRNYLMAHNLRIGEKGDFIFGGQDINFNAPRTINDSFLLSNLIQFSTLTLNSEFEYERNLMKDKIVKTILQPVNQISNEEISKITLDLLQEADKIKVIYNREYKFNVSGIADWNMY